MCEFLCFLPVSCLAKHIWWEGSGRGRGGESQQHRQKFSSCTSPIEHLYISQFPFVFRNVFVRRFSCHIFLFATVVGVATSVIIVVSCPLSLASSFFCLCFAGLFRTRPSKWGIRDLWTQFAALVSLPPSQFKLFVCGAVRFGHPLLSLSLSLAFFSSATRRKLNPKATTKNKNNNNSIR